MLSISLPLIANHVRPGVMCRGGLLLVVWFVGAYATRCQDFEQAQELYCSGNYAEAVRIAEPLVKTPGASKRWHELLIRGLLVSGRYPEALTAATNALTENPRSASLRWLSCEALLSNGETETAAAMAREIAVRALSDPRAYRDSTSLVIVGRTLLLQGADPKQVLNKLFIAARKADPTDKEVYLAGGELALQKNDYALAANWFQDGLKQAPDDADLQFGLARAYAPSEPVLALEALEAALSGNSNHLGSLLLLADRKIDAESYDDAEALLDSVCAVNPAHPEAWAYRAVIAHLCNEPDSEREARTQALKYWPTNPRVDYLIGLKLSQKYRFKEGAAHQMQALQFDSGYQPALLQLAQDWLRQGREEEGWQLADQVQKMDEYSVTAKNLADLQDVIQDFQTLTNAHFILRMDPHEARVYGPRALQLLEKARSTLCQSYGFEPPQPTTVEIFDHQSDFAVRTFGLPENDGFLGVCFGQVITANSPSSRAGLPFNWESMLWHEFCHVITLQLTGNQIPRWLSEGISVFEERQANPAWGEQLTPEYRQMLLDDSLIPISELSAAFMTPRSGLHLQFAYYHSSLVVEFLVQQYGQEALIALLQELGRGTHINAALARRVAPIETLEPAFVEFAHARARDLAPGLDWEKPDLGALLGWNRADPDEGQSEVSVIEVLTSQRASADGWDRWARSHPTNFWVMTREATQLVAEENWDEAQPILEQLVDLFPDFVGPSSSHLMLAETYRAQGNTKAEQRILEDFARREDEATDVYLRLMELVTAQADWASVIENAERYLAVNPLVAPPYRYLAQASEAVGETEQAVEAYRTLLELDPPNPAELRFRLAKLLYQTGNPAARRHLLKALEDAPRYREALELLLEMNSSGRNTQNAVGAKPET